MDFGLIADLLIRLLIGVGIGFTIGMTGISGTIVMPVMIYILGLSPVMAIGTGMLYSLLSRIYAVYEHIKHRTVRKRTAFYIGLGSIPAVLLTSFTIMHLEKNSGESFDSAIKLVIAIVMLVIWVLMLWNAIRSHMGVNKSYYTPPDKFPLKRKFYGFLAGIGVGTVIGSTSIGFGILIIPILTFIFQLSPNNAVGTSIMISIMVSIAGSIAYLIGGNISFMVAFTLFIGSIPGIWLGAKVAVRVPHKILDTILFLVITGSVVAMFLGINR